MILKAIVIILLLTGIASASVWVGDKEIGLAQYQDSGYVAGTYIVRDSSSNLGAVYIKAPIIIDAVNLPEKYWIDGMNTKFTIVSKIP